MCYIANAISKAGGAQLTRDISAMRTTHGNLGEADGNNNAYRT